MSAYHELPMQFEANAGQTDSSVKFLARGTKSAVFLTDQGAVLSVGAKSTALRLSLAGANPRAALTGVDPLPGQVNYLIGRDPSRWHTSLATFGKVRYRSVYPGTDLVYYGRQGRLEYDFVLAPGADPQRIRMHFDGAQPRIDREGNLVLLLRPETSPSKGRCSINLDRAPSALCPAVSGRRRMDLWAFGPVRTTMPGLWSSTLCCCTRATWEVRKSARSTAWPRTAEGNSTSRATPWPRIFPPSPVWCSPCGRSAFRAIATKPLGRMRLCPSSAPMAVRCYIPRIWGATTKTRAARSRWTPTTTSG